MNNNWEEEFRAIGEGSVRFMATRQEVKQFISNLLTKKDQEHKAELDVIKGEIDHINEEEIETDDGTYILGNFIDKKKALSILDKHINK